MKKQASGERIQKNDRLEVEITGFTAEGAGVGRVQEGGMAIFVQGTIPGERVLVHIIKAAKNYAVGKALQIIRTSEDRVKPDCPCFAQCGGCVYRHMLYLLFR